MRAVYADRVRELLRTALTPRQIALVGDARELREIPALAGATVIRPISVLEQ